MKLNKSTVVFVGLVLALMVSFGIGLYLQNKTIEHQAQKITDLEQRINVMAKDLSLVQTSPLKTNVPNIQLNANPSMRVSEPSRTAYNPNENQTKHTSYGKIVAKINGVYTISQHEKAELLGARFGELLSTASLVPNITDGKFEGFIFMSIKPNSIYTEFDLKVGDVVKSINGQQLASIGQTNNLLGSLRQNEKFEVEIVRDGHTVMLPIAIK